MAKHEEKNLEEWLSKQFGTGGEKENRASEEGKTVSKEMDDAELNQVLKSLGGGSKKAKTDKLSGILDQLSESSTEEDRIKAKQKEYLERVIGADKELEWLKDEYKELLRPVGESMENMVAEIEKPLSTKEKKKTRKSHLEGNTEKKKKKVKTALKTKKKRSSGKKHQAKNEKGISKKAYYKALKKLQRELTVMHNWVSSTGQRIVVLFEGRDAAGKGGTIKRISQHLNPRVCKIEALPKPSNSEKTQWYFQRYVNKLPSAGEIVLFDRSWYNRSGVEPVMGFCSEEQHEKFLLSCPNFENTLIEDGIILIKYWFEISPKEQESRLNERVEDRSKHWKISKVDEAALPKFMEYTKARDLMFERTHTAASPWNVVKADNKKLARLNCIADLLAQIPYDDLEAESPALGNLVFDKAYKTSFNNRGTYISEVYPK